MPLDTFICGTCSVSFNDIEEFILHKNENCTKPAGKPESDNHSQLQDPLVEHGEPIRPLSFEIGNTLCCLYNLITSSALKMLIKNREI